MSAEATITKPSERFGMAGRFTHEPRFYEPLRCDQCSSVTSVSASSNVVA